jgi:hypothetical protein
MNREMQVFNVKIVLSLARAACINFLGTQSLNEVVSVDRL